VTYHDPCHLNRSQGIRAEPRELLASKDSLEFRAMKFPCSCCGLGGGVGFTNYELSADIARRKAESVRGSGADIVATACPGCIVQIRDALHRNGVDAKVAHVVELL
jgi:Fe-S oxidoreductase